MSLILMYGVFALLAYGAWARGGVYPPWQYWLLGVSILLLLGFFLSGADSVDKIGLVRDPVLYLGAAFLFLLILQAINSGYQLYQEPDGTYGMYGQLPSQWFPWSVKPTEAMQMVKWFVPAFTALLLVRHVITRSDLQRLFHLMVWNATLLAVVGLVQLAAGAENMLGLWKISGSGSFFSTFPYTNHAGAFFYLHAALAAGLAHDSIKRYDAPVQIGVWVVCFLLCLAGALCSLSRAAGVASFVLMGSVFGVFIRWAWSRSKGNQLVNSCCLGIIIALAGAVLFFGAGKGALATEIEDTFSGDLETEIEGRAMQFPGAWQVVQDYPVFGCGGWGYRWMALLDIPQAERNRWGVGTANIHCDPLQFLCEFGWVGSLLMAGVIGWLLFDILRQWNPRTAGRKSDTPSSLSRWIGLGLLLIFLHSWIDLPFRCPAILIAWCTLLGALPKLAEKIEEGEGDGYEYD